VTAVFAAIGPHAIVSGYVRGVFYLIVVVLVTGALVFAVKRLFRSVFRRLCPPSVLLGIGGRRLQRRWLMLTRVFVISANTLALVRSIILSRLPSIRN
jgi:hypothetical protein